jgi:nitrous oxide reductase accessory protein NosL
MKRFNLVLLAWLFFAGQLGWAAETAPVKPTPADKCPVCGMFVAKYPDFVAAIVFNDGSYAVFDGAKDMFKYYFDMKKYDRARSPADIKFIQVTGYYNLNAIDGQKALYVLGSDVYGPMGTELIPFAEAAEAQEFMKDHKGKTILKFGEITKEMIEKMD